MPMRVRKFIGAIGLLILLCVYALLAMALGASQVVGSSTLMQVSYFLVAGLLWIIPAGLIVRWMQRPDAPEE